MLAHEWRRCFDPSINTGHSKRHTGERNRTHHGVRDILEESAGDKVRVGVDRTWISKCGGGNSCGLEGCESIGQHFVGHPCTDEFIEIFMSSAPAGKVAERCIGCLLYTSDAADE